MADAVAPYNFVPLSEHVVPVDQKPEPANQYNLHRKTGHITFYLTTETPLYVRCALTHQQFTQGERERGQPITDYTRLTKNTPEFFYTFDQHKPVIPGSSLRGMLRTLVEIVSFAKTDRVTRRKPFFRALADQTLRNLYQQVFVSHAQSSKNPVYPCYKMNIRTGFLRRTGNDYYIEECDYARIDHIAGNTLSLAAIPDKNGHSFRPGRIDWQWHNQPIYVIADAENEHFFPENDRHPGMYLRFRAVRQASFDPSAISGAAEGILVLTGFMQNKHMEFVFLTNTPSTAAVTYSIPSTTIDRFHDDDQISPWQVRNFPINKPKPASRRRSGMLCDGEPVFFLLDTKGEVRFLGRAQMFRLPYDYAPYDLIPISNRDSQIFDIADALFGYVRRQKQHNEQSCASRLFISDAELVTVTDDVWLGDGPITPRILATPKPTTFQHYIEQKNVPPLHHYSSSGADIRGYKLYWHKGQVDVSQIEDSNFVEKLTDPAKREPNENPYTDTQHTRFRPIKSGVQFRFSIYFENLTDVELGALLCVLSYGNDVHEKGQPTESYRLSLGMGKPLGMGAVKLEYDVVLSQRDKRYGQLFDEHGLVSGDTQQLTKDKCHTIIDTFTNHVCTSLALKTPFTNIPRIHALRAILSWPGPLPAEKFSRYMEIERDQQEEHQIPGTRFRLDKRRNRHVGNEYLTRHILPTPGDILANAGIPLRMSTPSQHSGLSGQANVSQSEHQHIVGSEVLSNILPSSSTALTMFLQAVKRSNAGSLPNLIHRWQSLDHQIKETAAIEMIHFAENIKVKRLEEKPWFRELVTYLQTVKKSDE